VFCLAKLSASNQNESVLVILLPLNSMVQEQFSEHEFTELGRFAINVKDWTRLSLETRHSPETFCCYQQTCHCSWMISYVKYIMKILSWNSVFEIFAITFRFTPTDAGKITTRCPLHCLLFKTSFAVLLNEHWMKVYSSRHVFALLPEE